MTHLRNKHGKVDGKKAMPYVKKRLSEGAMCKTIAEEIGMKQRTLAGMMSYWRTNGEDIPNMRYTAPEGHTRTRLQKGVRYVEMKVNGKWKQMGRADGQPYKEKQILNTEPKTKPRVKHKRMPSPKQPKKVTPTMPTRTVDPNTVKMVRVARNTHIQVPINMPDEVAIDNYQRKYAR